MSEIREMKVFSEHSEQLKPLGLLDKREKELNFDLVCSALVAYEKEYHTVAVPVDFVVPRDSVTFPHATHKLLLGRVVYNIYTGRMFTGIEEKEKLSALGVMCKPSLSFSAVYSALLAYKATHNHLRIPHHYIVPKQVTHFPPDTRGMRLGSIVTSIRCGDKFKEHRKQLEEIGLVIEKQTKQEKATNTDVV